MLTIYILFTSFISLSIQSFVHPGLLVTDADLDRASANLHRAPWNNSYAQLTSCKVASASYTPNAVSAVYRGTDGVHTENTDLMWTDAAAAFALALRWKLSGNDSYADAAANVLKTWGETLETVGGTDDAYLAAGFQGHEFANAGELLRDYEPFVADGFDVFKSMMTTVFLPMNLDFLNHVLGSEHNFKHFFANWELGNLASTMAIAVLTDNSTLWDFAVDYFKNGEGNGCINNAVTNIVIDPDTGASLGQGQESGRDQGHSGLDWQMLGVIGQQAWNQGEDLFGYNDSRILQGAEYFARYNLGHDVEFEPYTNGIVSFDTISNSSRGTTRPTWELLYAHYVQIKGMDAPWTTAYLNYSLDQYGGFEPGAGVSGGTSWLFDGLGWGSLLYHRDVNDTSYATTSASATTVTSSTRSSALPSSFSPSIIDPTGSAPSTAAATSTGTASVAPSAAQGQSYPAATPSQALTMTSTPGQSTGLSIGVSYSSQPTDHVHAHGCHARRHHHI
ncbi:exopolysaccharide inner membrane protein [Seiridium cupressi]